MELLKYLKTRNSETCQVEINGKYAKNSLHNLKKLYPGTPEWQFDKYDTTHRVIRLSSFIYMFDESIYAFNFWNTIWSTRFTAEAQDKPGSMLIRRSRTKTYPEYIHSDSEIYCSLDKLATFLSGGDYLNPSLKISIHGCNDTDAKVDTLVNKIVTLRNLLKAASK